MPFDSTDYAPVAVRIRLFFERYPEGRIMTRLISRTDKEITFKATVYRSEKLGVPAGTGWASERIGDGDVNAVACLENTETSAIGRALANIGFTASQQRPSAEEMAKASRERARLPGDPPALARASARVRRVTVVREPSVDEALQARADAASDALDLVGEAERAGLRPARAERIRTRLLHDHTVTAADIERLTVCLRRWLRKETERRRTPPVS